MLCGCGCGEPVTVSRYPSHQARFVRNHHRRGVRRPNCREVRRYRIVRSATGERQLLHRERAERALGRPLPARVVVHHADGSRRDDATLVICPDEAYHKLLHRRMRVVAAGGNPNTDKVCSCCRQVLRTAAFYRNRAQCDGLSPYCKRCQRMAQARVVKEVGLGMV